ncbi:unnamed protein product [Calypogeia fissa]
MDDIEVDSHSPRGNFLDLHSDTYSNFMDDSSVIQSDWDMLIGDANMFPQHICNPTTGPDKKHTHVRAHSHTHHWGW